MGREGGWGEGEGGEGRGEEREGRGEGGRGEGRGEGGMEGGRVVRVERWGGGEVGRWAFLEKSSLGQNFMPGQGILVHIMSI